MAEILLVRHAQSTANIQPRGETAFDNKSAPLTSHGIDQAIAMADEFRSLHDIDPEAYSEPILSSEFTRPQQTAQTAGFKNIHTHALINESDVDREIGDGIDVVTKHREIKWAPEESRQRARQHIEKVRSGELPYSIYFTHGMYIASFILELEREGASVGHLFDTSKRGYVPMQAAIIKVDV